MYDLKLFKLDECSLVLIKATWLGNLIPIKSTESASINLKLHLINIYCKLFAFALPLDSGGPKQGSEHEWQVVDKGGCKSVHGSGFVRVRIVRFFRPE